MDSMFMNSENNKTSDPDRLLLKSFGYNKLKENEQIFCFIKPWHLIYMEKYKKVIQK